MRILFAGSPAIAVPSLRALSELEMEGKAVILTGLLTNPDSRRGRHGQLEPTDVSAAASALDQIRLEKGLRPIIQLKCEKLDTKARNEVAGLSPDLLVSFAYGRIFGPRFLALFPLGGINIHPSLLPKYRGASPIPAVILAREKETGVCIQRLAEEMDAGEILTMERFALSGRETTFSLSETVSQKAAILLRELLPDFAVKAAAARPQEGEVTYCSQVEKEAGLIDWNKSAIEIETQIRAYTPWPLSFTRLGKETLYILEAQSPESYNETFPPERLTWGEIPGTVLAIDKKLGILIQTGDGILIVTRLQWQAKKALNWKEFSNGVRDFVGSKLG